MNNPRTNVAGVIIRDSQVLLVEYDNDIGIHYNFPGGGVNLNETLHDAVKREVWEEARARVIVGKLLAVWEYRPPNNDRYGNIHKIGHIFRCTLLTDSDPYPPEQPDEFQVGIRWIPLGELESIQLYPDFGADVYKVIHDNLDDIFYGEV